jgi:hypothetical protein
LADWVKDIAVVLELMGVGYVLIEELVTNDKVDTAIGKLQMPGHKVNCYSTIYQRKSPLILLNSVEHERD